MHRRRPGGSAARSVTDTAGTPGRWRSAPFPDARQPSVICTNMTVADVDPSPRSDVPRTVRSDIQVVGVKHPEHEPGVTSSGGAPRSSMTSERGLLRQVRDSARPGLPQPCATRGPAGDRPETARPVRALAAVLVGWLSPAGSVGSPTTGSLRPEKLPRTAPRTDRPPRRWAPSVPASAQRANPGAQADSNVPVGRQS